VTMTQATTQSQADANADLIARLEAATKPDQDIEIAIQTLIGLTEVQERHCKDWCRMDGRTDLTRERYIAAWAPSYMSSIDAALTLVPTETRSEHGLWWFMEQSGGSLGTGKSFHCCRIARIWPLGDGKHGSEEYSGFGPAPIAICIAALKARAAIARTE